MSARWKRSSTAAVASSLAVVAVPLVASAQTRREWGGEALQGRRKKEGAAAVMRRPLL
jgi:hypothetical protein